MTPSLTRRIDVRAVDRTGFQIPGVVFEWRVNGHPAGTATTNGQASFEVLDATAIVSVSATFAEETQGPIPLALNQSAYPFRFEVDVNPPWKTFAMAHFPAIAGMFFILLAATLASSFNAPTPLQTHVILAMLALGAGGFGGEIAGFINVNLTLGKKLTIAAGGAAAIFVVFFFFVPAGAG